MVNLVSLTAFPFYTSSEGFGLAYKQWEAWDAAYLAGETLASFLVKKELDWLQQSALGKLQIPIIIWCSGAQWKRVVSESGRRGEVRLLTMVKGNHQTFKVVWLRLPTTYQNGDCFIFLATKEVRL